jgi:alpha-L-arabinofuranosidase
MVRIVKQTTVRAGVLACLSTLLAIAPAAAPLADADPITLSVSAGEQGKAISSDLIGVFFEDLNHAGDGGLYPELIQNRSF